MVAVNLIHQNVNFELTIINNGESFFRGVAYNTYSDNHLLNVITSKMSAFPDKPNHFLEWVMKKDEFTYISTAESELGKLVTHEWEFKNMGNGDYELFDNETPEEREHNREVYKRAKELENLEWQELWEIFKGTKNSKNYGEDYDGTDIRSWWD